MSGENGHNGMDRSRIVNLDRLAERRNMSGEERAYLARVDDTYQEFERGVFPLGNPERASDISQKAHECLVQLQTGLKLSTEKWVREEYLRCYEQSAELSSPREAREVFEDGPTEFLYRSSAAMYSPDSDSPDSLDDEL